LAKEDPSLLESLHALVIAYLAQGRIQKAIQTLGHVMTVRQRTLSERHHDRLVSQQYLGVASLASAYQVSDEDQKAHQLLDRVSKARKRTLERDLSSLIVLCDLTNVYADQGRVREAETIYQQVLRAQVQVENGRGTSSNTSCFRQPWQHLRSTRQAGRCRDNV
jgi:tetratricopeptide (TPR) repeat protein